MSDCLCAAGFQPAQDPCPLPRGVREERTAQYAICWSAYEGIKAPKVNVGESWQRRSTGPDNQYLDSSGAYLPPRRSAGGLPLQLSHISRIPGKYGA